MTQIKEATQTKRNFENPLYKDKVVVLATSAETNGRYSLGQLEIAPGGGNGPHIHTAFTETFTAVKGTVGVMFKNKKMFLKPGESFTIPLRTPHYFFNHGRETVVCQVKLQPGHEGFEKGIAIGYGLAVDGKTNSKGVPHKLSHLALILTLTDTKPAGFMGLLSPFFTWLGRRAQRKGVEKMLLDKYYYE
jgi:mannose-6-phosphate isomerase-like protein (cupin superfamily)